jgi:uncharacterized protein YcbK (DUF882 family)
MARWAHFTDEEVEGLNYGLVARLDAARTLCGFPIIITSGLRTPEQNSAVGGVPDSSHVLGLAADIQVPVGQNEREKLIWALGRVGFKRLGLYNRHIHLDIDKSKAQNIVWFGVSH